MQTETIPKHKEIIRDGVNISYHIQGEGNSTLLFIHGSYIDQTYWKKQVSFFSKNYRVVTLDLAGHGESGRDRKKWSIHGFADDVTKLINDLQLDNTILIGHSMGAAVGLIVATTNLVKLKGFIAIDFFKNAATEFPEEMRQQIPVVLDNLEKDFAATNEQYVHMALVTPNTPEAITARVVRDYREAYPPMGKETMKEIFEGYKMEQELFPKLSFKLYLVNVDYFPTNEKALQEHAPKDYELTMLHGSSHFPMIEIPDLLNQALEKTIESIVREA